MKKLILFDFDGVIVDSEVIANQVDATALSAVGYPISTEDCIRKFTGLTYKAMRAIISNESGINLDDQFWHNTKEECIQALQQKLKPVQGIDSIIHQLQQQHIAYCIASSSEITRINQSLAIVNFQSHFTDKHLFSCSMVKKGKPHPDLFLHAATTLSIEKEHCIVIEDSTAGIQAAKNAGMFVIGFLAAAHTSYPWYIESIKASQPNDIAHSSAELYEILKKKHVL